MVTIEETPLKFTEKLTKRKKTTEIILHCSATPEGKNYTVGQIHNMHLNNKWAGIGYNFYIDLDGVLWKGRGEEYVGSHATNHNSNSIGICYCGGVEKDGKTPKDTRTNKQLDTMVEFLRELHKKYPNATIIGHNEVSAKACPSFDVQKWLKTINLDEEPEKKKTEQIIEESVPEPVKPITDTVNHCNKEPKQIETQNTDSTSKPKESENKSFWDILIDLILKRLKSWSSFF